MKILLTNDDGITSPVLRDFSAILAERHDVVVVAPTLDQSGKSQSFTYNRGLTFASVPEFGIEAYRVDGTPCDCVKFGVAHLLRDRRPDLVVSGINVGENAGISTVYSGTVAAAREGAMWGLPAIAVSMWKHSPERLRHAGEFIADLLDRPVLLRMPAGTFWNVNFPACEPHEVDGVEVTDMSTLMFEDRYQEAKNGHGVPEYWLEGFKPGERMAPGSDDLALAHNRIAITPLHLPQTCRREVSRLRELESEWNGFGRGTGKGFLRSIHG